MSSSNAGVGKTLLVAFLLCIFCSVIVSYSAVGLRDLQIANKKLDIKKNLLLASGLLKDSSASKAEILEIYKKVEPKIINFETGEYTDDLDVNNYDQLKAANNPKQNWKIPSDQDIAGIKTRAKFGRVYLVKENGATEMIILPIRGKGLWSTLYGFLAVDTDGNTIRGLGFYQHGETPGLGGEVDNPLWKQKWRGKKLYNEEQSPAIDIVKGSVDPNSDQATHQVDGLSGATITSNGVEYLVNFWIGQNAYGPFLKNFAESNSAYAFYTN